MKKIKWLHILTTIFLIGIVYVKTIMPKESITEIELLSFYFKLQLDTNPEVYFLSSILIGYLLSIYTTIISLKYRGGKIILFISLLFASLGAISYLNEFSRLLINHFQILISLPLFIVILNWISYSSIKKNINKI